MGKYFGTDGVRGQANDTLTAEMAYNIGRFVGDYFLKKGSNKIVIGKDTRISSSMLESALASGISCSGCDAYLIGYCSTPCLAHAAMISEFACGIMVSASHNVYSDNGIKLFGDNGLKIGSDIEALIEEYIDNPTGIERCKDDKIGRIVNYNGAIHDYQDWLMDIYRSDLSEFKVVADLANGSSCYTAKEVFEIKGIDVNYISNEPNGININNNCGSTHIENLVSEVKKGGYDLGFAFDGDADRVLFVDEDGELVSGDKIIYLLSKYLKDTGRLTNNTAVATVMSNIGLLKALDKIGVKYDITAVGDKNVADSMIKNNYVVGGEDSGHIIIALDSNFGDGVKTALCVLEALKYYGCSLKEAVKEMVLFPQLLINVTVSDKNIVLNDKDITGCIDEIARNLEGNGRILVRPSGTEPLIRVMVEAESEAVCHEYVYKVIDLIKNKGYAKA